MPEFSQAVVAMSDGEYTKTPVQTQFGWHVILVEEVKEGTQPTLDEVRQQLLAEVTRDAISNIVDDLREKAEIVNNVEIAAEKAEKEAPAE